MKKITSILIPFVPTLALAQEAEALIYEPSILEKIWWFLKLYVAWPSLSLATIVIGTWILLVPMKRQIKRFKTIHSSIVISLFSIWYFYPCFTFKGTYSYTMNTVPEETTYYIEIDDQYGGGDSFYDYQLKPIRRMLWVDIQSPLFHNGYYPVKLGWNKIYEWDIKGGHWDKRNKVKEN